jgi:hypothetical protein
MRRRIPLAHSQINNAATHMLSYGYQGYITRRLLDHRRPIDARTPDTPLYTRPEKGLIRAQIDMRGVFTLDRIAVEYQDLALAWLYNEVQADMAYKRPMNNTTRDAIELLMGVEPLAALRKQFRRIQAEEEAVRKEMLPGVWDFKRAAIIRDLKARQRRVMSAGDSALSNKTKLIQKFDIFGLPPAAAIAGAPNVPASLEFHARKVLLGDLAPTPAIAWYNNNTNGLGV